MNIRLNGDIRVLLADDFPIFRSEVRRLIESGRGMRVVCEADDGEKALAAAKHYAPDVAILDLRMPRRDGIDVARAIRDLGLPTRTILLSAHVSRALVQGAEDAGAAAYLPKDGAFVEIIDCVEVVLSGERYFSRQLPPDWRPQKTATEEH
jgi:two-component system nitrate/nitrite response regulator NarL